MSPSTKYLRWDKILWRFCIILVKPMIFHYECRICSFSENMHFRKENQIHQIVLLLIIYSCNDIIFIVVRLSITSDSNRIEASGPKCFMIRAIVTCMWFPWYIAPISLRLRFISIYQPLSLLKIPTKEHITIRKAYVATRITFISDLSEIGMKISEIFIIIATDTCFFFQYGNLHGRRNLLK